MYSEKAKLFKGREDELKKGIQLGIKKAINTGVIKNVREAKRIYACRLLKDGFDVQTVLRVTDLPDKDIEKIKLPKKIFSIKV